MKMDIYLGKDKEGKDFYLDFEKESIHLTLLLGETGSGKSIFHGNLYRQISSNSTPEEAGLVFFDMTRVDFNHWEKSSYLYHPVTVDTDEATELLEKLAGESELRAKGKQDNGRAIFIHIEECDMFYAYPERVSNALAKILEQKDKTNMYIVFSTSRIDPEFLTNLLKIADLKVVFHTATAEDSNLLLGNESMWDQESNSENAGERVLVFRDKQVLCQPFTEEEVKRLEEDF
ncbi:MAG: FtsK/SpoIIIE domain-containing protein [Candidatus Woykebacteria bacterium]